MNGSIEAYAARVLPRGPPVRVPVQLARGAAAAPHMFRWTQRSLAGQSQGILDQLNQSPRKSYGSTEEALQFLQKLGECQPCSRRHNHSHQNRMRIGGIFVGVDEHLEGATPIKALAYAAVDAEAMYSVFADLAESEGGSAADTTLLTGAHADRDAVRRVFREAAAAAEHEPFDLFVAHFSCHGTPEGVLLLHDSLADDVTASGLGIDELFELVGGVDAAHAVVALDVCFSGASAALNQSGADGPLLARLNAGASANRSVIWAARPTEQAWELPELGHGVLTHGLLGGLDGTTLAESGRIPVASWMQFAVRRAREEARRAGVDQHPGWAYQGEESHWIPARPVGRRRGAQLSRLQLHPITPDPESLAVYGLSPRAVDAVRRHIRGKPLNAMQVRAVERAGAMAGRSVVVAAPTSSGKTLVGELAAVAATARGRKAVVLLPTRALTAEKWAEFDAAFGGPLGLRVVRSFGGVDDDDLALATNHFSVAFLTYEKFLAMALPRRALLDAVGTIVLDEAHLLADETRGRTVEVLLTMLVRRRRLGVQLQIIALSAALGDLNGFPEWLGAELVREEERPVPLREGVISTSGRYRYIDEVTGEEGTVQAFPPIPASLRRERPDEVRARVAVHLAGTLLRANERERILAFRSFKPQTRRLAGDLGSLGLPPASRARAALESAAPQGARDDSRATPELLRCLGGGAAFHVADLEQRERDVVESAFRNGEIRAVAATSGLAMGINTPATTVLVVDNEHYDGQPKPYTVGEYKNMAGRAGRWLSDASPRGASYLVAENEAEADRIFGLYVRGRPEALVSRLPSLPREDLVLSLLAVLADRGPVLLGELTELAEGTFEAYERRGDPEWRQGLRRGLESALALLQAEGFVRRDDAHSTVDLTEEGRVCGREGLSFASARRALAAAEQLLAPASGDAVGPPEPLDELTLATLVQLTEELDAIYCYPSVDERPHWVANVQALLGERPRLFAALTAASPLTHTARLKRTFAIVMWTRGERLRDIENAFSRWHRTPTEPVAGVIRAVATRTADVVRGVARLVSVRHPEYCEALGTTVRILRPRLEKGVGRDGAELMRLRLRFTRGEWRALAAAGITTVGALRAAFEAAGAGEAPAGNSLRGIFGDTRLAEVADALARDTVRAERRRRAEEAMEDDLFAGLAAAASL